MKPLPRHDAFEVMRFIRDTPPTEPELLEYLGGDPLEAKDRYDALSQAAMIVCQEGRWSLAPGHLSEDEGSFTWENMIILLDEERYVIKPKVTWMPDDWEAIIGISVFLYFIFFVACAIGTTQPRVGLWIRDGVGTLCCVLFGLTMYGYVVSDEWTRLQKWQMFAQRTIAGLILITPLLILRQWSNVW